LYRFKCLDQSLVLGWLLRRQGVDARILFGARKEDNQMEAHAWVEVGGMGVSDDEGEHQRFRTLGQFAASKID
jgi:transglutaminase superfamily protein